MNKKVVIVLIAAFMAAVSVASVFAQVAQSPSGRGLTAIDQAVRANKYLFIFFYNRDDEQTKLLGDVFNSACSTLANRANPIAISVTDPSEAGVVTKFGVSQAPMPLVLVLAPNGAVTASFPGKFTQQQLLDSFGSPYMERLLGALQHGKLVLLCLQNGKTRLNAEAMNGVRSFQADQRYSAATEVLMLDPNAAAERPLLAKLGMNTPIEEATTIFLAPPGSVIGSFKGATDKNQIITTLTSALSSCGTGCKPGQCGVGK
jgi:hypothetical protein